MKKGIIFFLPVLLLFSCMQSFKDEEYFIHNSSGHSLNFKSYAFGAVIFEANLAPNQMASIPQADASGENPDNYLLVSQENADSNIVVFDSSLKLNLIEISTIYSFEATQCEKPKREIGCDWIFYVTQNHFAQADSI